jgi:hypothetical protein
MSLLLCILKAISSTDNKNNKADNGYHCRITLDFPKILDTQLLFTT